MAKKFTDYLESIGLTEPILSRVNAIYRFYEKTFKKNISAIFVSEYLISDGTRVYDNLWFFSEKFHMEAKLFVGERGDDFDITPVQSRIHYINIKKTDYDFEEATEKSRFSLEIDFDTGIKGILKSSKKNCDHLRDVFFKYFLPNLKE